MKDEETAGAELRVMGETELLLSVIHKLQNDVALMSQLAQERIGTIELLTARITELEQARRSGNG